MTTRINLTSLALCSFALGVASQNRPNVIVVLADDIGYGDLGCYGATLIQTPNLDQLAREGVRFTHGYAPASTSSPSRYALLTGEYAFRKNVGVMPADAPLAIDEQDYTLPRLFQDAGYQTALVGKWHLGLGGGEEPVDFNRPIEKGPLDVGFDYAYYFPATNDRVPCVYIENRSVCGLEASDPITVSYRNRIGKLPTGKENPEMLTLKPHLGHDATIVNGVSRIGWMDGGLAAHWNDATMAQVLSDKAIEFIRSQKDQPFFLYYAPHNAHEPRIPSPQFQGVSLAGVYGDVIEEFDYYLGRLIDQLKDEGVYENTLIIVSSDNGPMIKEGYLDGALENLNGHNPYRELRGDKYSLHEGGLRVPLIASWPDKIQTAFVQSQPYCYVDMLATCAGILQVELTKEQQKDSFDGSSLFLSPWAADYRPFVVLQNNGGDIAIRQGDWKFIPSNGRTGVQLYDLKTDPSELRSLHYAYPEQVKRMRNLSKSINR